MLISRNVFLFLWCTHRCVPVHSYTVMRVSHIFSVPNGNDNDKPSFSCWWQILVLTSSWLYLEDQIQIKILISRLVAIMMLPVLLISLLLVMSVWIFIPFTSVFTVLLVHTKSPLMCVYVVLSCYFSLHSYVTSSSSLRLTLLTQGTSQLFVLWNGVVCYQGLFGLKEVFLSGVGR